MKLNEVLENPINPIDEMEPKERVEHFRQRLASLRHERSLVDAKINKFASNINQFDRAWTTMSSVRIGGAEYPRTDKNERLLYRYEKLQSRLDDIDHLMYDVKLELNAAKAAELEPELGSLVRKHLEPPDEA